MALFNEILVARFNRGLQKLFGMKGTGPSPQLAGEIYPVYLMDQPVEERFLYGWSRFWTGLNLPGNVAGPNAFQLRNPKGSNVIAIIEKISIQFALPASGGDLLRVSYLAGTTDLTSLGSAAGIPLDPRQQTLAPIAVFSGQNNPALPSPLLNIFATNGTLNQEIDLLKTRNQEIALPPGFIFFMIGTNANITANCALMWRERFLEEPERT